MDAHTGALRRKNEKKAIILFLSILFSFSSCSKKSELIPTLIQNSRTRLLDKLTSSETKDNNEISEKIIDGIFSKDVEKIKNLFSKQSSLEISDIDAQIKRLIDLVNETNIKEYKIENGFEGMSREYGKIEELSRVCFIWFPNYEESKYRINIDYYKINLKEPEMEGLVNIRFYKQIKYEDPELIIEIGNKRV